MRVCAPMGKLITYDFVSRTTRCRGLVASVCLILGMLFAPAFSLYARAQAIALGTNVSNAPVISVRSTAMVTDGIENFFAFEDTYLPATVYYLPDTAFGPIPYLINVSTGDTLPSQITFEDCRMAWRWTVEQPTEATDGTFLFFSTHETAMAEIIPVCLPDETTLPDTAVCVVYQWGDTTIYDSGNYTRHFVNGFGCDSVVTQRVTILQPSEFTDNVVAYDSLKWLNGTTYYRNISGPIFVTENVAGCDSIITLNLTIRHLWKDTVSATVCQSELPYIWNGKSLTQSDIYSTDTILGPVEGKVYQDSLHSLILTVNPTFAVDTFVTLCDSSYTWHDSTYLRSGVYVDSLLTVDGCDSIISLHLTLTDDCFPKEDTCIDALRQIEQSIVINRSMIDDFESMRIQWLCDDKTIDTNVDRLLLSNRPNGEYSAYLTKPDCPTCDTIWICPLTYEMGDSKQEKRTMLSVHPTYVSAAEPYIYLTATNGAGSYYIYGPAGKIVLRGEYNEQVGEQKLALPAISGLYVLICLPEGESKLNHVVQKIKLIVY